MDLGLKERVLHQLSDWLVLWGDCAATECSSVSLKQYLCYFHPQTKHSDNAFRKHTCQWSRQLLLSRGSIVSLSGRDQTSCITCPSYLLQ